MKEFSDYIGSKFRYGAGIQWSLENEMKTRSPSPMRPTGNRDNGELPSDQKFVWEKRMTEYVKKEKNLD